jgi:hypothetical protein
MPGGHALLMAMERLHRLKGEPLVLHRTGATDVTVNAKLFGADDQELTGSMDERVRRIRITNFAIAAAAWPGPPRQGDTIGDYVIVGDVDTRKSGTTVIAHLMDVSKAG